MAAPPAEDTPGTGHDLVGQIQALRRYAGALVGNHADADDLVQETLKRALTYLDADRRIDNLRAYLFTTLHNVRIDMLRRRGREGHHVPVEDELLVSADATQSDRLACHQTVQAMQKLTEEQRQALLLVAVEGLSYREAAEVLEVPVGTVMSRLNRGRSALREILQVGDHAIELGGAS